MLEPIPFWGYVEVDLPVKTHAGNKPNYVLTCGCRSEHNGIFCEWDTETRECDPAIAYGCLCSKHYMEYEARPTEVEK